MKDDSAPQGPRIERTPSNEKRPEIIKKDDQITESTMKGNITFS
jgi:hypothetical protein